MTEHSQSLQEAIEKRNVDQIIELMKHYDLTIKNNKIVPKNPEKIKQEYEFWDKQQYIRKIQLNSLYGAILNPACRMYDERIGQSVTLSGRRVVKHLCAKTNEILTNDYDYKGKAIIYSDTDSVDGNTLIRCIINNEKKTLSIQNLFDTISNKFVYKNKHYAIDESIKVLTYDPLVQKTVYKNIQYVYKHETQKHLFQLIFQDGKSVVVTEDHSIMVNSNDMLIERKPSQIKADDIFVTTNSLEKIHKTKIQNKIDLGKTKTSVYDIGVDSKTPYFFGNDILLHNSVYFSAWPLRNKEEFKNFQWTKENVIMLYDYLTDAVNETWPSMMKEQFNVHEKNCVIRAGRELVATKGLFITKKRYAVLIIDKEGIRQDVDGKPGKIKAMGLDLKRSDTPEKIQDFLESVLLNVLLGHCEQKIIEQIKQFREQFDKWLPWEKGTPKRVNNMTSYKERDENRKNVDLNISLHQMLAAAKTSAEAKKIKEQIDKIKKLTVPGHVAASLNWNKLKQINNDFLSMPIQDGQKIMVCKLKSNIWNMTSIAYPIDEMNLPDWFKNLPFDVKGMEETILDGKLENLLGILNWDLSLSKKSDIDDLFEF